MNKEPPIQHLDLDFLNHPPAEKADFTDAAHFRCFMELNQNSVIPGLLPVLPCRISEGRYINTRTDKPTLLGARLRRCGGCFGQSYIQDRCVY